MILINESKKYLQKCLSQIRVCCRDELKLELNEKTQIVPLKMGVDYLGFRFRVSPTGKIIQTLQGQKKKHLKKKLKTLDSDYRESVIDARDLVTAMRSMTAYLDSQGYANTWGLREKYYKKHVFRVKAGR